MYTFLWSFWYIIKKNGRSQILFMELLVKKENFPKISSEYLAHTAKTCLYIIYNEQTKTKTFRPPIFLSLFILSSLPPHRCSTCAPGNARGDYLQPFVTSLASWKTPPFFHQKFWKISSMCYMAEFRTRDPLDMNEHNLPTELSRPSQIFSELILFLYYNDKYIISNELH